MMKIGFYNREREKKEIMSILNTEPTLITFIYGPINSGKTELAHNGFNKKPAGKSQSILHKSKGGDSLATTMNS